MKTQDPVKDEDAAHPVATVWRSTFREIVRAFAAGDYQLKRSIDSVAPVPSKKAQRIQTQIENYGEALAELPDETWQSSVSQWMETHWEVLVDLWTVDGESDLVLFA